MHAYRSGFKPTFNGFLRALPMLSLPWLLACGVTNHAHRTSADKTLETANFYWKYAALAANVYETAGRIDTQFTTISTSTWIRDELRDSQDQTAKDEFEALLKIDKERMYQKVTNGTLDAESELSKEDNFDNNVPSKPEQCNYDGKKSPAVPIAMAVKEFGWDPVFELHRQLHPKSWSVFVPGLAIDVWRRKRAPEGESPVVEYAFVYRGTEGSGGWFSNLRALTAFTPAVWDQYKQAEIATKELISQIDRVHGRSDAVFKREAPTRVRVTAVGHSLGGGLAKYVFMRIPQITLVVAFDPSPVDGSSQFTPFEVSDHKRAKGALARQSVLNEQRRTIDRDARSTDTNIFVLYEEGEALTALAGCASGPIWGSEGGPVVRCESLNLSSGSMIRQHNMAQLACKLYLAKNGQVM
jgi:hypothetical protein